MTDVTCQRWVEAMDTRFDVILRGDDAEHLDAVAVVVCEEVQRLDALLSRFDKRSEIARINREAVDKFVRVDRELFALLERCEQARALTDGYFDVTLSAALLLDADDCAVRLTRPDAAIDLGAIGKGYALDCGREIILRYGVTSGLLQGGTSSILATGNETWPIAVRHPLQPERLVRQLALARRGFSCSAVRHVGQSQSDILNPHTNAALTGDEACYVLATSATEAEIFSTALLAMGKEMATQFLCGNDLEVGWING
ncbi:MAG: FAD:protein FMN transferase [Acidobacteria bacterium]|nr:FAD:protein FMN transferase [Acidobacteriota bacterium]